MTDFLRFYYLHIRFWTRNDTIFFRSIRTLFPKMVTNLSLGKIIHRVTLLFWQFPTSPVIDYKGRLRDELLVKNLCPQLLVVTQKSPQEIFMTLNLHSTKMRFDKILSTENFMTFLGSPMQKLHLKPPF